jgi:hypothetical protein
MATVDKTLLERTNLLGGMFDAATAKLTGPPVDLRFFFTVAHGFITKSIAKHIDLFANPNALMRLNDSFASTYLTAINGHPHQGWQKAFRVCNSEQDAVRSGFVGLLAIGPVAFESCGACMAYVHINRDLREALTKVTDVDAQDYGNMLILVQRGNIVAEVKIRGAARGTLAIMASVLLAGKLNLDVKEWRNKVFEDCYRKSVPEPTSSFVTMLNKREGI